MAVALYTRSYSLMSIVSTTSTGLHLFSRLRLITLHWLLVFARCSDTQ